MKCCKIVYNSLYMPKGFVILSEKDNGSAAQSADTPIAFLCLFAYHSAEQCLNSDLFLYSSMSLGYGIAPHYIIPKYCRMPR